MKTVLIILGTIAFLMGLADSLAGALIPHGRGLIIGGVIGLVVAGVLHLRQKWQQTWKSYGPLVLAASAILSAVDTCAMTVEQALTPPAHTPMVQRSMVNDADAWGLIAILILVGLLICFGRSSIKKSVERSRR